MAHSIRDLALDTIEVVHRRGSGGKRYLTTYRFPRDADQFALDVVQLVDVKGLNFTDEPTARQLLFRICDRIDTVGGATWDAWQGHIPGLREWWDKNKILTDYDRKVELVVAQMQNEDETQVDVAKKILTALGINP